MKNTQKWISEDILRYFEKHNISTIDVAFIENQMSPQQIYHYLRRMEKESGLPVEKILTIWRDYLSMAKKIGENLKDSIVYRPRELERRHDEAVIAPAGNRHKAESRGTTGEISKSGKGL